MMQLPALEMHEGGAEVPGSPSSPGSDPGGGGGGGGGSSRATTPREKPVQVLPCPRCESMNTKFCYYNNYSVTQPRHFCRQCQRYWTAGGTLRNVPVGGGSRKKNRPHHAHRPGEPYLQQQQRSPGGSGAGSSSSSGPFAGPLGYQHQQQQQHEILLPGFAVQQQHQYVAHHPYGLDQLSQLSSGVYASILNKPPPRHDTDANLHAMFGNQAGPSIHPGGYSYPSFQPEHQSTVKPEYWPVGGSNYQASRFESSPTSPMVPNLGLINHPDRLVPQWDQSDMKPTTTTTMRNGSSPLHDSSIEEEGSIPSNGYSKSGYEEGDAAVSSMWHNLHDMDNLHLSVKW